MLQAAAVDGAQCPRALAGGQQLLIAAALMADPANGAVIEGTAAGQGERKTLVSAPGCGMAFFSVMN